MAHKEKDEGFLVELIDMLQFDKFNPVLSDLDFIDSDKNDFPGMPEIPDPNQLSLPGVGLEPEGAWTERIMDLIIDPDFMNNRRDMAALDTGKNIALSSILKQFDEFPAEVSRRGTSFINRSIGSFFKDSEPKVTQKDVDFGTFRQELEAQFGRDI